MSSKRYEQEGGQQKEAPQRLTQIQTLKERRAEQQARVEEYHKLRDRMSEARRAKSGRSYWRSLEELADTPEFRHYVENEFPEQASEFNDPIGRRRFIQLMGASLALAGLTTSCKQNELIVPYVQQPLQVVPGRPLFFATAIPRGGIGLLVQSNAGRPTKVEGNPDHPASLGHTDIFAQASILQLYDPERARIVTNRGEPSNWARFFGAARAAIEAARPQGGAGLRFLTETVYSPTLARQLQELLNEHPQARWYQWEPVSRDNARNGSMLAFGRMLNTIYRFERAERVLSIGSDFLMAQGGANLRFSHDYILARTPQGDRPDFANQGVRGIARLYAVESAPNNTGAKADHRLPLKPSEIDPFARAVAAALGVPGAQADGASMARHANWINALARDLGAHRGRSIVIVGDELPPAIHALGHAMNAALNNVGATVSYTQPVEYRPANQVEELRQLVAEMNAGQVQTLFILGPNPVYNAPADFNFAQALLKVPFTAQQSLYADETSLYCQWHLPQTHFLEEWSDTRAFDGTVSIVQPLINPLYQGRSFHEVVGALAALPEVNGYDIVRATYAGDRATRATEGSANRPTQPSPPSNVRRGATQGESPEGQRPESQIAPPGQRGTDLSALVEGDFDSWWHDVLQRGLIPKSSFEPLTAQPQLDFNRLATTPTGVAPAAPEARTLEFAFRPDPSINDGYYANNSWLQELPNPLTSLTWDNAAIISPATAARLGLKMENTFRGGGFEVSVVKLSYAGAEIEAPVWILPGQPEDTVTLHLGFGRTNAGIVGNNVGYNAYALRPSWALWQGTGMRVTPTGRTTMLASTQVHFSMEGREPVRVATIDRYQANPEAAFEELVETPGQELSMYPQFPYPNYRWGMAIDNNACVGCNACVVACQSENNVPVVGKEQVLRSREMHWLRIDNYYHGGEREAANPEGPYFEPLMCVHCEVAPCEPVCPVHATVHTADGLSAMVYNRCIGTRYCSNNCPYKVRRFNFFRYQDWETEQFKMMRNPEVTVRSRGVMEKCSYCVQRIQTAKIDASRRGDRVRDGEVITACQAACPTEAIIFGDLNDQNARVTRILAVSKRQYPLLGELNTQPRTRHLGVLRNPNPEIEHPGEHEFGRLKQTAPGEAGR